MAYKIYRPLVSNISNMVFMIMDLNIILCSDCTIREY